MTKTQIKTRISPKQGNLCAITGAPLDLENPALIDTDRIIERFRGGEYTDENTRIVTPRAHMDRHGNLRERNEWMTELKALMDSRQQTMKLAMKIQNQLLAYKRLTDEPNPDDIEFLGEQLAPVNKRLSKIGRQVEKQIKASDDPLVLSALGVVGLGAMTIAGLQTYIDLEKATSASAMWSYTGLHKSSGDRYTKGEAGGGNKTLRTILWNTANSMTKNRNCPYRIVYDQTKERLANSERIVKSRNNQGKLVEVMWKDAMASHRHGAALRAVMKHLLADYWFVGRAFAGLDTRPMYVQERLGHESIIQPADRGWAMPE